MGVNIPIWNQYVDFLVNVLNSLTGLFHSAGLGIIAFTIIVKTLMLPLTVKVDPILESDAGAAAEDQGAAEEAWQGSPAASPRRRWRSTSNTASIRWPAACRW